MTTRAYIGTREMGVNMNRDPCSNENEQKKTQELMMGEWERDDDERWRHEPLRFYVCTIQPIGFQLLQKHNGESHKLTTTQQDDGTSILV